MDAERKRFFLMTVEIRILTALLSRSAFRSFEDHFAAHNVEISGIHYGILRALSHQSFTISDLSRRFMLDPSTLVPMIDSLERKGLVERGRDPHDRRRIPLSLTEDARELLNSVSMFHENDVVFQRLETMGEDKARELLSLLREVIMGMPNGAEMIDSVSSRLYTLAGDEIATGSPECPSDFPGREHHRTIRRTHRRRIRKTRSE